MAREKRVPSKTLLDRELIAPCGMNCALCARCGGTVSCHNGLCFHCDFEKLRAKKRPYRWD